MEEINNDNEILGKKFINQGEGDGRAWEPICIARSKGPNVPSWGYQSHPIIIIIIIMYTMLLFLRPYYISLS